MGLACGKPSIGGEFVKRRMRCARARQWGGCWLAMWLWRDAAVDLFWSQRLGLSRIRAWPLAKDGGGGGTRLGIRSFVLVDYRT